MPHCVIACHLSSSTQDSINFVYPALLVVAHEEGTHQALLASKSSVVAALLDATIFYIVPCGSLPLLFAFDVSNSITIFFKIGDTTVFYKELGITLDFLDG
jgi:hypothetical protein